MLNRITIMGRLTRDPELRRTGSGTPVASFTVAVDRDYAADGQEKETDFLDCVAWRGTAEFVEKYFSKGGMIVVSGRLQIRPWTDKEGNKRRSAEIVADNVYFGEGKKDSQQAQNTPNYQQGNVPNYGQNSYPGSSSAPMGYGNPGGFQPQFYGGQQQAVPNYSQQGFGGYQQPQYPQQTYQAPASAQGSYAPIEGDDPKLPF